MGKGIDFEPEVRFPADPFAAARVFLGVMAYPERGSGQPGGLGVKFCEAMRDRVIWSRRKAKGLRSIRALFQDNNFKPPELREFEGTYNRGLRRLRRRASAYSIFGTQWMQTFFAVRHDALRLVEEGMEHEAYFLPPTAGVKPVRAELWRKNAVSTHRIVGSDIDRWAKRLSLNTPVVAADSKQKIKDLIRRAYLQSRPVLHMAHAFNEACTETGPKLAGWGEGDFVLVMLINAEKWVFPAIESAMRWRQVIEFQYNEELAPEHMIRLLMPKAA